MPVVLKSIAATAAVSLVFTIWLMLAIVTARGVRPLLAGGALGLLTLAGWAVTLLLGPVTAVQLWQLKDSGRRAGLVFFGFGVLYYMAGFLWLRQPGAHSAQIAAAVVAYALPAVILATPAARRACH